MKYAFLIVFSIYHLLAFAQKKDAIELLDEGVTLLNKGRSNDAYMKFSEGVAINGDIADLHFGKANAAFNLNFLDTAIVELEKAIELNGDESEYYNLLGNIYYRKRDREKAILNFEKAIDNNPTSKRKIHLFGTYYNCGTCYLILKEYKKGEKCFNEAIDIDTRNARAYHNRGICLLRQDKLKDACSDMEKAVSLGSLDSQKYIDKNCYE